MLSGYQLESPLLERCWNAANAIFCSMVGGRGDSGDKVVVSARIVDGLLLVLGVEVSMCMAGEDGRESERS